MKRTISSQYTTFGSEPIPLCLIFFFLNDPAPPKIHPLPLPAALPIFPAARAARRRPRREDAVEETPAPAATVIPNGRSVAPRDSQATRARHGARRQRNRRRRGDRKSTRLNSSYLVISHSGFCLENNTT